MNHTRKAVTFPFVLALALAGGNALAAAPDAKGISAEQIKAGMPAEVAKDGEEFVNKGEATELQHRVNEQTPDAAVDKKSRKQLQTKQEGKGEQHKHQKKLGEQTQKQEKSGSFGAFSGKGQGGGNGGGGGGRN